MVVYWRCGETQMRQDMEPDPARPRIKTVHQKYLTAESSIRSPSQIIWDGHMIRACWDELPKALIAQSKP
jgi:hypothetical protein